MAKLDQLDVLEFAIAQERDRREQLWVALCKAGGPLRVAPSLVKELGIQRGQQGIFRDHAATAGLTEGGGGVALSVRHTGSAYADDLGDDDMLYHYPSTNRGVRRDTNEIEAMKACGSLGLPLFVVITLEPDSKVRDVRRGWVVDHDDDQRMTLISFSEAAYDPRDAAAIDEVEFRLTGRGRQGRTWAKTRPGQRAFRFAVFKRYGRRCALCDMTQIEILQAAHLCPVEASGSDDPRNGMVLCLNHHRAFDLGLVRIHPDTLDVVTDLSLSSADQLRTSIKHLARWPAREALRWAWEQSLRSGRKLNREK